MQLRESNRKVILLGGATTAVLDLNFTNGNLFFNGRRHSSPSLIPGWSFSRASVGYAETAAGALTAFASGAPRITDKGILIEEARTNLLLRSQALNTSPWTSLGSPTVTENFAVAPDGTATSNRLVATAADEGKYQNVALTTAAYTQTFFAKDNGGANKTVKFVVNQAFYGGAGGNREATFNTSTGVLSGVHAAFAASSVTALANGNWRVALTFTPTTATTSAVAILSATTNIDVLLWGAQLELGAFPTSYIVTTSASATRAADVASITGLPSLGPVTVFAEAVPPSIQTNAGRLVALYDAPLTSEVYLAANATTRAGLVGGTGLTVLAVGPAVTSPGAVKVAASLTGGTARGAANGQAASGLVGTATIGPVTTMFLGDNSSGNRTLNGYLRRAQVFNSALSDAQLQAMTA